MPKAGVTEKMLERFVRLLGSDLEVKVQSELFSKILSNKLAVKPNIKQPLILKNK